MKSLLGLVQSAPCRLDIEFKDAEGRPYKRVTTIKSKKEETEEVPVYSNKDSVIGEIRVTPMTTKKMEHQSIKVQLLGQIELASERGVAHEFLSLVRDLAPPGELTTSKVFPFEFKNVEMQYDSYRGQQVRCRYLLRVTVTGKGMTQDSRRDFNIWVTNYEEPSDAAAPIKMEVGIEDCLHIEFEYDRARYHLKDVVVGRIYFLLVRIKLKHMEIEIRRKETVGAGKDAHSESETLAKYEIMDGAPVRGESVPIRLYLDPYDLAPTYRDVHNKLSVRYYLNLVLVDEEDRRYFKQQEITLFRKREDSAPAESITQGSSAFVAAPPKLTQQGPALSTAGGVPAPATSPEPAQVPVASQTTTSSQANSVPTPAAAPAPPRPAAPLPVAPVPLSAAPAPAPAPQTAPPLQPTSPQPAAATLPSPTPAPASVAAASAPVSSPVAAPAPITATVTEPAAAAVQQSSSPLQAAAPAQPAAAPAAPPAAPAPAPMPAHSPPASAEPLLPPAAGSISTANVSTEGPGAAPVSAAGSNAAPVTDDVVPLQFGDEDGAL